MKIQKTDFYWWANFNAFMIVWFYNGIIIVFLQSTKTYSHYSEKNTTETRIIKKTFSIKMKEDVVMSKPKKHALGS